MRNLDVVLGADGIVSHNEEAPLGQCLSNRPVRAEPLARHHPPGCLRRSFPAAYQGEHHPADLRLGKLLKEFTINTLRIGAERPHDTADIVVLREGDPVLPLLLPQLGERETQQREPATVACLPRDQRRQPRLIPDAAHLGGLGNHPLHSAAAHRGQSEKTAVHMRARIGLLQQLGQEVSS